MERYAEQRTRFLRNGRFVDGMMARDLDKEEKISKLRFEGFKIDENAPNHVLMYLD